MLTSNSSEFVKTLNSLILYSKDKEIKLTTLMQPNNKVKLFCFLQENIYNENEIIKNGALKLLPTVEAEAKNESDKSGGSIHLKDILKIKDVLVDILGPVGEYILTNTLKTNIIVSIPDLNKMLYQSIQKGLSQEDADRYKNGMKKQKIQL